MTAFERSILQVLVTRHGRPAVIDNVLRLSAVPRDGIGGTDEPIPEAAHAALATICGEHDDGA